MLILRCILSPEKLNLIQKKYLTSHLLENLEHPDKKLNSLGIILILWKNLKPLEKYQHSPSKKILIYKKNVIFNNPEKCQPSWKSLNPYTWKIFNLSKNP